MNTDYYCYYIVYGFASNPEDYLYLDSYLQEKKGITEGVMRQNELVLLKFGSIHERQRRWVLGIRESLKSSKNDQSVLLLGQNIAMPCAEWHGRLKSFCKQRQIRFRKPQWIIGVKTM